ncbi:hypothetical protein SODALDRAFT_330783 [Sodiomyces alkalinus F11]|uniref:Uncharacterized protein n=1 Tax=Sodiomyces alkalinus (strain CBS 110278 / VKM F-3762 / F11) TaxID=1314773 RepID=A0A3N2Q2T0_SODAK|nr:hypothetical protein SODALDRAFT_330783 [Sodiomyces alkalinus F11]ROT41063.1 hypothetical protein SODALDRAFT_330783 [Sodiomyces alkalinus F11]
MGVSADPGTLPTECNLGQAPAASCRRKRRGKKGTRIAVNGNKLHVWKLRCPHRQWSSRRPNEIGDRTFFSLALDEGQVSIVPQDDGLQDTVSSGAAGRGNQGTWFRIWRGGSKGSTSPRSGMWKIRGPNPWKLLNMHPTTLPHIVPRPPRRWPGHGFSKRF